MTTFYQYEFISPDSLFAEVKEEMKSYFDTGAVDDLMFPIWTKRALRKLQRGTLPIYPATLYLDDFSATLPNDFKYVREAWICTDTAPRSIRKPGSFYTLTTTLLNRGLDNCEGCDPCALQNSTLVYKTTEDEMFTNTVSHLLRPGNAHTIGICGDQCPNLQTQSMDTFVIQDGKFHTSFRTGDVFITYYSDDVDSNNYPLVPENDKIEQYILSYLKYKTYEMLWNQITDESSNQIDRKYQTYKIEADNAFASATNETKNHTNEQKRNSWIRQRNRFNAYRIG